MASHRDRYDDRPPLPVGAETNPEDLARVAELAARLPGSVSALSDFLQARDSYNDFDPTRLAANDAILARLGAFHLAAEGTHRQLLNYAQAYMAPSEVMAVCRMVLRGGSTRLRERCVDLLRGAQPDGLTLPARQGGAWDWTGLLRGVERGRLFAKQPSQRLLERNGLPQLTTVGELRAMLKLSSPELLGYLLLSTSGSGGPYATFTRPKRSGGERLICAPNPTLKQAQRAVLENILARVPVHDAAHGFVEGRSTVTNARAHLGRELLIKFDLRNFFPSITYYRVMGLFAHLGYYLEGGVFSSRDSSRAVAPTLARLTTYTPPGATWRASYTPQGAPTSPIISNLICRRLDARLYGLAARIGATYTRYADDLTFSMNALPESGLGRFRWWVDQICVQEGFFINHSKFRVIRKHQRQQVTGIVVNEALRVPREERRRFRAILHNCRTQGVESQARGRAGFREWLLGYASYMNMVNPTRGGQALAEVQALLAAEGPST
ncbi:MAG: hypothetical protein CMH57_14380 [Myxococcales bacterium]|nr:hypothetical protein [Myxococcales bacterium]